LMRDGPRAPRVNKMPPDRKNMERILGVTSITEMPRPLPSNRP
jgi:hypothetical protein